MRLDEQLNVSRRKKYVHNLLSPLAIIKLTIRFARHMVANCS